jgi:superfamily II DNA or RNA helicase
VNKKDLRENGGLVTDIIPLSQRETIFKRNSNQNIELYSYQKDAIQLALTHQRGIIKCATGKTLPY